MIINHDKVSNEQWEEAHLRVQELGDASMSKSSDEWLELVDRYYSKEVELRMVDLGQEINRDYEQLILEIIEKRAEQANFTQTLTERAEYAAAIS